MKKIFFLMFVFTCNHSFSQKLKFKEKYQDKLELNSKLIESGYNYTVEKLNDSTFLFKRYYPETKAITLEARFNSKKLEILHGEFIDRYDNGEEVNKGLYVSNMKEGKWLENSHESGVYKKGERHGRWVRKDTKDRVIRQSLYKNGRLNGKQIYLDTLGQIKYEEGFTNGKLVSTTQDTSKINSDKTLESESMPRFTGCETNAGTNKEKKSCADQKMLRYIYSRIKYPKKARKERIQGTALVRFVIDKEGVITNIEILRGLSKGISEECKKLLEEMPKWRPGMLDGKPVKVQFNLPIKFKLE